MPPSPIIVWFRQDLRLSDQRALSAAVATQRPLLPVYILDDQAAGAWKLGAASRWWLHQSLNSLSNDLAVLGAPLILRRGNTGSQLAQLAAQSGATSVYCSHCYEPWAAKLETDLKRSLASSNAELKRFSGVLLKDPGTVCTKAGDPFKVYTPYWRAMNAQGAPPQPLPRPDAIKAVKSKIASDALASWGLEPAGPDWAPGLRAAWHPGESGANANLARFLDEGLTGYADMRNRPDKTGTSRLSAHLHFGEISPHQCWHAAAATAARNGDSSGKDLQTFHKELVWREFSYNLLSHWPNLPETPFRKEFAAFPWQEDTANLKAWQRGRTGYPIVDAGMRELWHTGWMHNRVRMVAASFLIKHLLIPWQQGEAWFWDTLVDADLASNAASWQWVAGSGADAAPYFRIFNPVTQGETFDPDGGYVRRWVPEIAALPNSHLQAPWTAPASILSAAGVTLGQTYPHPIVDHGLARLRALAGYESVKSANTPADRQDLGRRFPATK
ncbi:MAG: deoxyribodipyrimidine photo-lyase [Hyphomicrobium sp.]